MGKFIYGQNTKTNRDNVRRRLTPAFHNMLARDRFLAISYASRGRPHFGKANNFRFFTVDDNREIVERFFKERFGKMRSRLDLTKKDMDALESILQI